MTPREGSGVEPIEILRLQVVSRALENEALMRYVSKPGNVNEIGAALGKAFKELQDLAGSGVCPMFWHHERDCRCVPDELYLIRHRDETQFTDLVRDMARDIERLAERLDAMHRRIDRLEKPSRGG